MSQATETIAQPTKSGSTLLYEQPLNERMRTFLRLEFLYKQLSYLAGEESSWASRGAITSLLDVAAILSRGDVRGDVLKELERQLFGLERLQQTENVDTQRLEVVVQHLQAHRGNLNVVGPKYLQELRDNEFLNAIRHRSSIPGGTCAFDLPEYTHWLRQDFKRRSINSKQPVKQVAVNGVYQHAMNRDSANALIRLTLPDDSELYPEISGGQHRCTVRLMKWNESDSRPVQTKNDIEFELAVC